LNPGGNLLSGSLISSYLGCLIFKADAFEPLLDLLAKSEGASPSLDFSLDFLD
jgi:hypothetical protein